MTASPLSLKMVLMNSASSSGAAPVIAMRAATVGYAERAVLRGVDFQVDAGEVVALVGPNGSGKTTLVRGLLGLAEVLEGEVDLFGIPLARFHKRHRIGYVPQRHTVGGAIPSTVREVVSSGRLPRQRWWARMGTADRRAVDAAIATVGLAERSCAPVSTLSGGQQRRLLIARALAGDPEVLVMDEPTAGVDAESQANLANTLADLVDRGLTLLVVTHEIEPLRALLTRVVTVEGGRLVRDVPAGTDPAYHHDPGHDPGHTCPDGDRGHQDCGTGRPRSGPLAALLPGPGLR